MMSHAFLDKLDQLVSLHKTISGLNPALENLFPIAIVKGDDLLIYDLTQDQSHYQFKKKAPVPMPISIGIRAAFQLNDYGGRIACVVTPDIFNSSEGFVTILHEFVHCYQYETCEQELKVTLDIARQAQENGDVMWEIEHPFPYNARDFIKPYDCFLNAMEQEDTPGINASRKTLKVYLGVHDFEYMVWQEWKEGFARWIENLVKRTIGLEENKGGLNKPYSRELFYAGGEAFINYLAQQQPKVVNNLRALFKELYTR